MKTGFVKANVNIPGNKNYKYHGLNKECVKQNDPASLHYYDTSSGPVWVKEIDVWPNNPYGNYELGEQFIHALPSSQNWVCSDPCRYLDNKKRYWYAKIDYYTARSDELYMWLLESGKTCSAPLYMGNQAHVYIELQEEICSASYIFILVWPATPTHVRVWRSSNGELPAGSP